MTEPQTKSRYSSPSTPEFATYPASSEQQQQFASESEYAQGTSFKTPSFEEPARKIGAALGRLTNKIAEFTEPAFEKVEQFVDKAEDELAYAKEAAGTSYEDFAQKARAFSGEKLFQAKIQADMLRRRAIRTANEHPERVILAAGIAGIIAGFGLRAWRENRD